MAKCFSTLQFHPERCDGCTDCMTACAQAKAGTDDLRFARIRIMPDETVVKFDIQIFHRFDILCHLIGGDWLGFYRVENRLEFLLVCLVLLWIRGHRVCVIRSRFHFVGTVRLALINGKLFLIIGHDISHRWSLKGDAVL